MTLPRSGPDLLATLDDLYPLAGDAVASYRRDGHVLLRGVASAEEVAGYGPAIVKAVEAVARSHDPQGRLDDSALPNRTASRREVLTVIYFADGARVREPDNPHGMVDLEVFVPGVGPGEPAASPLNPVLFST